MEQFADAYKRLNNAQRLAVDTIEGPLLVIAGPGTGKTELLGVRVANIMRQTDAAPSNIICLTFTNKAATNMRDRLLTLIGPTAHSIAVRTFHSFAAELMKTYPEYFWNGARLSIAPDAIQLEIIRDILATLPIDNPLALKFAGNYTALSDVQQAIKLSKEAGLTPDKLQVMVQVNQVYLDLIEPTLVSLLTPPLMHKKLSGLLDSVEILPDQLIEQNVAPLISLSRILKDSLRSAVDSDLLTNKTTQTGKWKQQWLQTIDGHKQLFNERQRNIWWLAVADVYQVYRQRLHGRSYYDYADMIIEVIGQLEQRSELRADVQERYQYLLIDEFQDTNAAQLRLAHLVASHYANQGKPNLMAVGDDDQSIFAFNGAELGNMLSFRRMYPATKIIVLSENYRSSQAVLDVAKLIIEQTDARLVNQATDATKNLQAVNKNLSGGIIEHLVYPTRPHQLYAVVERLAAQWQTEDSSIAVLARSHDSLKRIASLLLKLNVPVRYEQQSNILDNEAVKQLILLSTIVIAIGEGNRQTVNYNLSEILSHPMWQLSPKTLWQLATSNYVNPDWLSSLLDSQSQALSSIGNWLVWLAREASRAPLPLMLEYLIGSRNSRYLQSPLRDYYTAPHSISHEYLETLSALELLTTLSQEFAANETAALSDFVRFTELNRNLGRIVSNESWFVSGEKAIQLLTVHKAKGLEFDTVYIIDVNEDIWKPRAGGRKPPANLPLQPYGDNYDDYIRLMYVAATRAKRSLIISSYSTDTAGKSLLAAPFVRIALPAVNVDRKQVADPIEVLEASLQWPRLKTSDEKQLLQPRLDNFNLSVSGLIDFLNITTAGPQYFFEKHLLRLPSAKSSQLAYGSAIHSAMETAQRLTNNGQFNIETVIDRYETSLREQYLPPAEFNRFLTHGTDIITQLFTTTGYSLEKGSLPEQSITAVQLDKALISGRVDRLDPRGSNLTIIDYKTGKPLTNITTKDRSQAVKAWKFRTQLTFYTLLIQNKKQFAKYSDIDSQIVYLEASSTKILTRSFVPSADELVKLRKLINLVWQHIKELNFPDVSAYPKQYSGIEAFIEDLLTDKK